MSAPDSELLTYPLPAAQWPELIAFWQTEWPRTDVDWLEALRGACADSLTIRLALARAEGAVVGTASVYYPRTAPEACCVADVLTSPRWRGRGIAAALTARAVEAAFGAGCRVAYLGNKPTGPCVYDKVGFQRLRGSLMRRAAPGGDAAETAWYRTGQSLSVRETVWGDLPGFAALLAQPFGQGFADYPRGLFSVRQAAPIRCVSAFTTLGNEVAQRGGKLLSLVGESPHRVLGFGSLTPGPAPACAHRAVLEVAAHDAHPAGAALLVDRLLAEARARPLRELSAFAATADRPKLELFQRAGFHSAGTLRDAARFGEQSVDIAELRLSLT